jgi:pyruvate formate lyase activating enzyme
MAEAAGVTRRRLLRYGALGAAALCGVGTLVASRRRSSDGPGDPGGIFPSDAPDDGTFERWRQRGWAREARYATLHSGQVECGICPNRCVLRNEDRSRCRTRVVKAGKLYTLAYGNPCSLHVDPIEKKPLFHFLPGTRAFSLATAGCNLRCLNCQNWEISQKTPEETKRADGPELRPGVGGLELASVGDLERLTLLPEDVVAVAKASGSDSIAYTYSEPVSYYEYLMDTARLARQAGVKNVWVTNGYINPEPLAELCRYLDAANVNLKSFSEEIYATLNSGKLQPILGTLQQLKARGVWFEVTNLVIPRHTDDLAMFGRMCDWLVKNLGVDQPLHISRFHPKYRLDHLPSTPIATLTKARDVARQAGLRYVYVGNAAGVPDAETTFCPRCRRPVVQREVYEVQAQALVGGKCAGCGERIPGVWAT